MSKTGIFISVLFILNHTILRGQTSDKAASGIISISTDPATEALINEIKLGDLRTSGFRVQLTSESGNGAQQRANEVKNRYTSRHKEHNAYLMWDSPNFKVRVGDFKTKFEAAAYWKTIQYEFPNSYVVEDKIGGFAKKPQKSE
jgi:hypothetical protein